MKRQIGVGGIKFGPREKKYIQQVVRTSRVSYGPLSQKFEQGFARAHGCRFGAFCNSGTSALHIALTALKERHGWQDEDEVLVPAVTFVATANIVFHNRMRPVFVDVDRATYNIDPALIEARITPRTRAIIPVHLTGLSCDMDPILEIARRRNLKVIEDSCETTFGVYKGKKVGSFGDIGCFSTYVAHYIVTGVGGLALTNDPDLAVRLRSLMNHGRDSIYIKLEDALKVSGARLHEVVSKRFSFVSMGHSFRCTEFEAALGLAQLEQRSEFIRARRKNARILTEGLKDLQDYLQLPVSPADRPHMFMVYPVVLKNEEKKGLVNFLEDNGIETRDLLPVINQPIYTRTLGDLEADYPAAAWINHNGFYVGCHPLLKERDLQKIVETIRRYFKR